MMEELFNNKKDEGYNIMMEELFSIEEDEDDNIMMGEVFNIGDNMFARLDTSGREITIESINGDYDCTLSVTGSSWNNNYGPNCPYPIRVGAGFILAMREISKMNDKIDALNEENHRLKNIISKMVSVYKDIENEANN